MNRIYCDQAPNDATWAAADRGRSAGRGVGPAPEEANAPLFDKSTYFRVRHSPTIDGLTNLTLVRSEGNRSGSACRRRGLAWHATRCDYTGTRQATRSTATAAQCGGRGGGAWLRRAGRRWRVVAADCRYPGVQRE